jgi:hypothetical protein
MVRAMSDGVRFTITTVEFQDGPYQAQNFGEPIPVPVDPIDSTSSPAIDSGTGGGGGGGGGGSWGHLDVKLRLGGSGRAALVLTPADVDLRLALTSGPADIATESDLADVSAIEGLYPLVTAPTLRNGVVNFQLVATAPAGEEVSEDGSSWGGTATHDSSSATSLIQNPDDTVTGGAGAAIEGSFRFQRRKGDSYTATDATASASVLLRMYNPTRIWKTIKAVDAADASFVKAKPLLADVVYTKDLIFLDGSTYGLYNLIINDTGAGWSVVNSINVKAETVKTIGSGNSALSAVVATVYDNQGIANAITAESNAAVAPCGPEAAHFVSGTAYTAWTFAGGGATAADASTDQLASLSTSDARAIEVQYVPLTPAADLTGTTYDNFYDDPATPGTAIWGASAFGACVSGDELRERHVGLMKIAVPPPEVRGYVGQFAVKADWP